MSMLLTRFKYYFSIVLTWLLFPFECELCFTLTLWILASSADLFYWSLHGHIIFAMYMAIHGLVVCYVTMLICSIFKGVLKRALQYTIGALGIINLITDAIVHSVTGVGFTDDMVSLILATNISESSEFFTTYLNFGNVGFVLLILTIIGFLHYFDNARHPHFNKLVSVLMLAFTLLGYSSTLIHQSKNWDGVFLLKAKLFCQHKNVEDIKFNRKSYEFNKFEDRSDNIVVIIGESLCKDHMRLYGYSYNTTPLLLQEDPNNLIAFDSVFCSCTTTLPEFRRLMTTARGDTADSYYLECPYLMDIVKSGGYHTEWISNQSSFGIGGDNEISKWTELVDSVIWCGKNVGATIKEDFDGILIDEAQVNASEHNTFSIIHLMGSHEAFNKRYPKEYDVFKEADYQFQSKYQRKTMAEYDNSVLYNDFVIDSIFHCYDITDAIVLYFPDHALDVFSSSDDFAGHAKVSDSISVAAAKKIPFLVYMTPLYLTKHMEKAERIRKAKHKFYCTDDLPYTVMDLMGVSFPENDEVIKYSLFSNTSNTLDETILRNN